MENNFPEGRREFLHRTTMAGGMMMLPGEAASVYKRAFALLSYECHSPIIAFANRCGFSNHS